MTALSHEQRELVLKNLRLAYWTVNRLRHAPYVRDLTRDERESASFYGLCKAAGSYDPARGKFSTFAVPCIRRAVFHEARRQARARRTQMLLDEMLAWVAPEPSEVVESAALSDDLVALRRALEQLDTRQRRALDLRYWQGLRRDEVARELGCSCYLVDQIEGKAMTRLRKLLGAGECGRAARRAAPTTPAILAALDGRVMQSDALALIVGKERRQLVRDLDELLREGVLAHLPGAGFYRPDAPPPGMPETTP